MTLLLLLSRFSRVRLCATPQMAAHQVPPSLGFSRQEHWSGLPFPSPMHESEKWKWSCSVVSDSSRSHGLQPTRLLRPWDFPGKSSGVGCHCLLCPLHCTIAKTKWQCPYRRHPGVWEAGCGPQLPPCVSSGHHRYTYFKKFIKPWERTSKVRGGEIGKHKLN